MSCTFVLTKESTEPLENVHVSDINQLMLTIDWSPPRSNGPVSVTYNIAATDCGTCPNATTSTSIKCTNLTVDGQACSIVIQTIACGSGSEYCNSHGATSLTIILKGILIIYYFT